MFIPANTFYSKFSQVVKDNVEDSSDSDTDVEDLSDEEDDNGNRMYFQVESDTESGEDSDNDDDDIDVSEDRSSQQDSEGDEDNASYNLGKNGTKRYTEPPRRATRNTIENILREDSGFHEAIPTHSESATFDFYITDEIVELANIANKSVV